VFDTSESLRSKRRRKDTGGSGAGTNSVAIVQANHQAGQLLSAGKGFLLSIYRVLYHASQIQFPGPQTQVHCKRWFSSHHDVSPVIILTIDVRLEQIPRVTSTPIRWQEAS